MTPDRLVGIYLVGGSSRIPLIATLIAEQLRVVPSSLDQPETAVALGAHHVTQEGVSLRTSNLGPQQAPPDRRLPAAADRPDAEPRAQQRCRRSGPAHRTDAGHAAADGRNPVIRARRTRRSPQQVPAPQAGRRKLLIGVAAVVVLAVVAVGAVFLLRPASDLPTARELSAEGRHRRRGLQPVPAPARGHGRRQQRLQAGQEGSGADVSCSLPEATRSATRTWLRCRTRRSSRTPSWPMPRRPRAGGVAGQRPRRALAGGRRAAAPACWCSRSRPAAGRLADQDRLRAADDFTPDTLGDYFAEKVQPGT